MGEYIGRRGFKIARSATLSAELRLGAVRDPRKVETRVRPRAYDAYASYGKAAASWRRRMRLRAALIPARSCRLAWLGSATVGCRAAPLAGATRAPTFGGVPASPTAQRPLAGGCGSPRSIGRVRPARGASARSRSRAGARGHAAPARLPHPTRRPPARRIAAACIDTCGTRWNDRRRCGSRRARRRRTVARRTGDHRAREWRVRDGEGSSRTRPAGDARGRTVCRRSTGRTSGRALPWSARSEVHSHARTRIAMCLQI